MAPSAVEEELYAAKSREDWASYLDVLARNELYYLVPRAVADARPGQWGPAPVWNPHTGTPVLALYTAGMLPAPLADPVFVSCELAAPARHLGHPGDPPWLVVNPDSPCEGYFPTTPWHRSVWQHHVERNADHESRPKLRTLAVGGPLEGPLAHGLACGALLFVNGGHLWNSLAFHGSGYTEARKSLRTWWGVHSRQQWLGHLNRLLAADMVSGAWEFVLGIRHSLARSYAGPIDVAHWREVAERELRHHAAQTEVRLGPEGVTRVEPTGTAELEGQVKGVKRLIGRIARYEARFRADGLLAENAYVRTVEAWDHGRASGMARWGVAARFGTVPEAETAVLAVSESCRANYRSWEDFAAAFVLGRCLHFDDEEFGSWYQDMVTAHHVLTTDPASPWLTVPWA
nr:DUF1266 domain-containing protein [Streptomyces sp. NA04227]